MAVRERTRPPVDAGAPPAAPPAAEPPIDEGPMRRELLRQIAQLDEALGRRGATWKTQRTTPRRGPAIQPTQALADIRDELLAAVEGPRRR